MEAQSTPSLPGWCSKKIIFPTFLKISGDRWLHDKAKEILYHKMPNLRKKKMTERGHNYMNSSIFRLLWDTSKNLEAPGPAIKKPSKKEKKNYTKTRKL